MLRMNGYLYEATTTSINEILFLTASLSNPVLSSNKVDLLC